MKVEIFDPPLCCTTGLCGPGTDPVLVKMHEAVLALQKQGVEVIRHNLSRQPKDFVQNKTIARLLQEKGKEVLPVTLVEGDVFKTEKYPSYEDLCERLGIEPLKKGRPISIHID